MDIEGTTTVTHHHPEEQHCSFQCGIVLRCEESGVAAAAAES